MPTKKKRPAQLKSVTVKQRTGHSTLFIIITYKRKRKPFEVFIHVGKSDQCEKVYAEALARSISMGLRHGVKADVYIDQLRNLTCTPIHTNGRLVLSPADGVAKALQDFIDGRTNASDGEKND
tara:strand:- start:262 stop:630 length:369 start_codon:yes stop_codon:yes gene_type:complete